MAPSIHDVREFWQRNPLWSGESTHVPGTAEFFAEHRQVYIDDCFAGRLDERIFPRDDNRGRVLDLGCGPGFWTVELGRRGCRALHACDLTEQAVDLARERCRLENVRASFEVGNAETLGFASGAFSHVNCLGVIHHTPDTAAAVREIARILSDRGSATIAVYYRNLLVRSWPIFRPLGRVLASLGVGLRGRGREDMIGYADVDDIVRRYDGAANPIGKAYSRAQFIALLEPHFHVRAIYYHSFPARALGLRLPHAVHRLLHRLLPFMIYVSLEKRSSAALPGS